MSDLISRHTVIELIHSLYPSAPIMRINRKRWEKKYKPYIEAEKALEMLPSAQQEPSQVARDIANIIENEQDMRVILSQPDIIRCRDCKEFRRWIDTDITFCDRTESEVKDDDFCSRAERREDESD